VRRFHGAHHGEPTRSCITPFRAVAERKSRDCGRATDASHPVRKPDEEDGPMLILPVRAINVRGGVLRREPNPTECDIDDSMTGTSPLRHVHDASAKPPPTPLTASRQAPNSHLPAFFHRNLVAKTSGVLMGKGLYVPREFLRTGDGGARLSSGSVCRRRLAGQTTAEQRRKIQIPSMRGAHHSGQSRGLLILQSEIGPEL